MSCVKVLNRMLIHNEISNMVVRQLSSTSALHNMKWRLANGYPAHWNERGILTDGPDYSYPDGQPTPYTNGQRRRLLIHRENTNKILHLLQAVKVSKESYAEKLRKEEEEKQTVLSKKLKPKGNLWKKKQTIS